METARIYKIIHLDSSICYIGSTFLTLEERFKEHKYSYLNEKKSSISIYPYFKKYGVDRFKIILIKEYQIIDRRHLTVYEQLHINKLKSVCVNKANPCSFSKTLKKYYDKKYRLINADRKRENDKKYREANKDMLKIKQKKYYETNGE